MLPLRWADSRSLTNFHGNPPHRTISGRGNTPKPPFLSRSIVVSMTWAGRTTLVEMRVLRSTCSRALAPTKIDMPSSDEVHKAASGSAEELCAVWWLQSPCWVSGASLRAICRKSQARVRGQVRTEASTGRSQPGRTGTSSIRLRTIIADP